MRLAKFRSIRAGYFTVIEEESLPYRKDCVRVSEWVDIEFPPMSAAEIAAAQKEAIAAAEKQILDEFESARARLRREAEQMIPPANMKVITHE